MKYSGDFFKANWRQPSVIALVLANLVPLFGVLIFHWSIFPLMFLFWFENLIIGLFNELRMIVAVPFVNGVLPGIPFFCVHYGIFLAGHLVIIVDLFGGGIKQYPLLADPMLNFSWHATAMFLWQIIHENHLELAVLCLAISRGTSFVTDYLRCGEYRRTTAQRLFWQPYGRIIVLHIALIGGGILIKASHSPLAGLVLLVVLKIALDLAGHLWERNKLAAQPA
ncbi:MAG: DUF6498-containing protein [Verrucomicrobiota bacterium]|jgi:hypothetical protein